MAARKLLTIAIAGNPNCGKTALFNALTGARQHVGNWPGVTVEKKEGYFELGDRQIRLVDLPGTYALFANAEDERAAVDYLLSREASLIINIVDATNLERNLFLTSQLADMHIPMVIAVNMMDIAENRGIQLDLSARWVTYSPPPCRSRSRWFMATRLKKPSRSWNRKWLRSQSFWKRMLAGFRSCIWATRIAMQTSLPKLA